VRKPRRPSIFDKGYAPYGTTAARGSADAWRRAFREASEVRTTPLPSSLGGGPFAVLGIEPGVTLAEARRAYRRLALVTHPDRGGSAEDFRRVQEAWEEVRACYEPAAGRRKRRS